MQVSNRSSSRRTVFENTVECLYGKIFGGDYAPGSSLRELDVAAELGVSRSPVREALRQLEQDGLLSSDTRNGWREVVRFTVKDFEEIYQIRAELEGLAVELATPHITADDIRVASELTQSMVPSWPAPDRDFAEDFAFHKLVCQRCNSQRILALLDQIWLQNRAMLVQFNKHGAAASSDEILQVRLEHEVVVSALAAGNAKVARSALTQHILGGPTRKAVRAKLIHSDPEMESDTATDV